MDVTPRRRWPAAATIDGDTILQELTMRQFVRPHTPLAAAVAAVAARVGLCDVVGERAVRRLELDSAAAIGRVKRAELARLAHTVCRYARRYSMAHCR